MGFLENMLNKTAEKAFNDPKFQQSWQVHMKAFRPILEPAFVDKTVAKVHLTSALNRISRGECAEGMETLKKVKPFCETDADNAAWHYFMALACERSGDAESANLFYLRANEFEHSFYLPYLKSARSAHEEAAFETAEIYYRQAISCISEADTACDANLRMIVASAKSNLASCLTMMHRCDEAIVLLDEAKPLMADTADLSSFYAILYAALNEPDKAKEHIAILEKNNSRLLARTVEMTGQILAGKHAHFSAIPPERALIAPFWQWFEANEAMLVQKLRDQEHEDFLALLTEKLAPIFPFMEQELLFGVMMDRECKSFSMDLSDFFAVALRNGYEELIAACPDSLKTRWSFKIVH